MEKLRAKDIMTKDVISVFPDMPLITAARLLIDHSFHGLPVVDDRKKLVGILTEYDLISKNSLLHLPTLQILIEELHVESDLPALQKEAASVRGLKVKDVMNTDPLTLPESMFYENIIGVFRDHHRVNPIPVVNDSKEIVGVISRFDILKPLHRLDDLIGK